MCHLQKAYEKHREKGLVVLGVNCADELDIALEFLRDNEATFPNVLAETPAVRKTCYDDYQTMRGMSAVPMTVIIDREGKVAAAWYGQHDPGRLRRVLDRLGLE